MKRVLLFLATNIAVLIVLSIVLQLLGVESILDEQGIGLDYRSLLVFSAVFGVGGSLISLLISKWSAKRMTGAKVITEPRGDAQMWLVQAVKRHADAAGIGMPEVAIYEDPSPNAFATGARRNAALVAVSTGLFDNMRRDQVDAVLGHEISHIASGDMITLTLLQGVVNTFVIFLSRIVGYLVDRVLLKNERGLGMGYFVSSIAAQIVFGILASTIVLAFSRRREFRADAGGARLAGRENMIGALEALGRGAGKPLPDQIQAFGISGGAKNRFGRFFMSHPPLEERIEALKKMEFAR